MASNGKQTQAIQLFGQDDMQQFPVLWQDEEEREALLQLDDLTLPQIAFPTSGGLAFNIIGEDGKKHGHETLEVVLLAPRDHKAFHHRKFSEAKSNEDRRPACASPDGITGYGDPTLRGCGTGVQFACRDCIRNVYYEAGQNPANPGQAGKDCQDRTMLYVLHGEFFLPAKLDLPRSSRRAFRAYLNSLAQRGRAPFTVLTEIGLETTKNAAGIEYSIATFRMAGALTPEVKQRIILLQRHPQIRELFAHDAASEQRWALGTREPGDAATAGADYIDAELTPLDVEAA